MRAKFGVLFLFFIIFFFHLRISAQLNASNIYVYLKNGNIYYGKIIEMVRENHIKVQTLSHNIIYIDWKDISFISKYSGKQRMYRPLSFKELKNRYLKTKLITSFNTYFRGNRIKPFFTIEKPLSLDLSNYFFIKTNLILDKTYFTNIDLMLGYKFIEIQKSSNFFMSFSLGGYYSASTVYLKRWGITAEIIMGNTFLTDEVKAANFRMGLKLIMVDDLKFDWHDDAYYPHAEQMLFFIIGLGLNI
ncbi:hypothetical protein J7L48_02790 [bacterium]|nr:hypothetical protein [bacterium]